VKSLQEKPSSRLFERPRHARHPPGYGHRSRTATRPIPAGAVLSRHPRGFWMACLFEVVENDLKSSKAGYEMLSKSLLIGQIQAVMEPTLKQNGGNAQLRYWRTALPSMRFTMTETPAPEGQPCRSLWKLSGRASGHEGGHLGRAIRASRTRQEIFDGERRGVGTAASIRISSKTAWCGTKPDCREVIAFDIESRKTTGPTVSAECGAAERRSRNWRRKKKPFPICRPIWDTSEASALKKKMAAMKTRRGEAVH